MRWLKITQDSINGNFYLILQENLRTMRPKTRIISTRPAHAAITIKYVGILVSSSDDSEGQLSEML